LNLNSGGLFTVAYCSLRNSSAPPTPLYAVVSSHIAFSMIFFLPLSNCLSRTVFPLTFFPPDSIRLVEFSSNLTPLFLIVCLDTTFFFLHLSQSLPHPPPLSPYSRFSLSYRWRWCSALLTRRRRIAMPAITDKHLCFSLLLPWPKSINPSFLLYDICQEFYSLRLLEPFQFGGIGCCRLLMGLKACSLI
ncbi:hypothetical protein LINPERPRIM_LOCUS29467, partial [Linum perenne]